MKAIIAVCALISVAFAAPSAQVPYQTNYVYGRGNQQIYDAVTNQVNQVPYLRILPNNYNLQNPNVYNYNNNLDQINNQRIDQFNNQRFFDQVDYQRLNDQQRLNFDQQRLLQNNLLRDNTNVLNNLGGLNNLNNVQRNNDVLRRNEQLRVANQIAALQQQNQVVGPVVAKTRLTQSLTNVGSAGVVNTANARLLNDRDVLLTHVGGNQQNLGQLQVDVSQGLPLVLLDGQNQQNQAQRLAFQQNRNGQVLIL